MSNQRTYKGGWQTLRNWFLPGLGIKRWMLVVLAGITFLGVGLAILLLDFYRTEFANQAFLNLLSYVSLRFLPRIIRVVIFGGIGVGITAYGIWGLNRALLRPFVPVEPLQPLARVGDQVRELVRAPQLGQVFVQGRLVAL